MTKMMKWAPLSLAALATLAPAAGQAATFFNPSLAFQGVLRSSATTYVPDGSYCAQLTLKRTGSALSLFQTNIPGFTTTSGAFTAVLNTGQVNAVNGGLTLASAFMDAAAGNDGFTVDIKIDYTENTCAGPVFTDSFTGIPINSVPLAFKADRCNILEGTLAPANFAASTAIPLGVIAGTGTAGNVLTDNGTAWVSSAPAVPTSLGIGSAAHISDSGAAVATTIGQAVSGSTVTVVGQSLTAAGTAISLSGTESGTTSTGVSIVGTGTTAGVGINNTGTGTTTLGNTSALSAILGNTVNINNSGTAGSTAIGNSTAGTVGIIGNNAATASTTALSLTGTAGGTTSSGVAIVGTGTGAPGVAINATGAGSTTIGNATAGSVVTLVGNTATAATVPLVLGGTNSTATASGAAATFTGTQSGGGIVTGDGLDVTGSIAGAVSTGSGLTLTGTDTSTGAASGNGITITGSTTSATSTGVGLALVGTASGVSATSIGIKIGTNASDTVPMGTVILGAYVPSEQQIGLFEDYMAVQRVNTITTTSSEGTALASTTVAADTITQGAASATATAGIAVLTEGAAGSMSLGWCGTAAGVLTNAPYFWQTGDNWVFETSAAFSATPKVAANVVMGLFATLGTATPNGVYFSLLAAGTQVKAKSKNGTVTVATLAGYAANAFHRYTMTYTAGAPGTVNYFLDGVSQGTDVTAVNQPTGAGYCVGVSDFVSGAGGTSSIDYTAFRAVSATAR